ncbi:SCO2524 family protein [Nocardia salmonicida]|uniref:SCO2524 family protein n=1 Tax=Nocardia salmonicida TaxID=53431 RepID=UPI0007C74F2E|nr:SCO2524 family protein [Nocardia salmonicida]
MRIQPRQQILDIWSAMLSACYRDEKWHWDGVLGANSISDSEQLLCLLYPATEIESFSLDRPELMADDVQAALSAFGGPTRIGIAMIGLMEQYLRRNTGADGTPRFDAGSYLRANAGQEPTREQLAIEVVDSYSMSVTLCLAGLGFARVFDRWANAENREDIRIRIADLRAAMSDRLTIAMTGLIRSFVVNTVSVRSPSGKAMLAMLNQSGAPENSVVEAVRDNLDRVRARLRTDVKLGRTPHTDFEEDDQLFECGWSWGVVQEADPVEFDDREVAQTVGIADPRPYLYFTVVALDGINDILSQRTRELDLLNKEQQRLADALRVRWDLTQRYWSTVARFGAGRWPLEDIPWRTSDGEESDYFSLIVSAVLIQELIARTASDDDLTRAVAIFDELSRRGRITRRPTKADSAVALHDPGVRMVLAGTEKVDGGGPQLTWIVSDFATVLLKRALQAAQLSSNIGARDQLMELAKNVMDHLDRRVIADGAATGLWDDPAGVFGGKHQQHPSWYLTERMVECLVAADRTYRETPLRSTAMVSRAVEILNEAEHLLNQAMLEVSIFDTSANRVSLDEIERKLGRARALINTQPATSFTLASTALKELDDLAYARSNAMRST